jgi:hypothetical protein
MELEVAEIKEGFNAWICSQKVLPDSGRQEVEEFF